MQSIGRRYVQYIHYTYRRRGTLWEGRHKASLIQAENHLLTWYRYIEMNPVRAQMVEHPGDYPWSSYRHHAYGKQNAIISDHSLYYELNNTKKSRLACYRELFLTDIENEALQAIRKAINFSMPLGNNRFQEKVEGVIKRKVGYAKQGKAD